MELRKANAGVVAAVLEDSGRVDSPGTAEATAVAGAKGNKQAAAAAAAKRRREEKRAVAKKESRGFVKFEKHLRSKS